jgi:ribosomal protein L37AE/L43A
MGKTIPSQDLKRQQAQRRERLKADPTCSKCGKTKTIDDFPPKAVDYWCSACRSEYAIGLYHKQRAKLSAAELLALKDQVNERQRQRRIKRLASMSKRQLAAYRDQVNRDNQKRRDEVRDIVYRAYGGYKCSCCGETEPTFLSIDHINNDGAKHKREHRLRTGEQMYRWLARNKFPKGFQVLCMNCQWGKRNNNGVCPHSGKV